jgi:hypothetical protein
MYINKCIFINIQEEFDKWKDMFETGEDGAQADDDMQESQVRADRARVRAFRATGTRSNS